MPAISRFLSCALLVLLSALSLKAGSGDLSGSWAIDREAGTAIDPWSRILLEIRVDGKNIHIGRTFSTGRRTTSQEYTLQAGKTVEVPVQWWPGNRHIGAYIGGDRKERIHSEWADDGRTLLLDSHYILSTSQGETPVRSHFEYRLSRDGSTLTVIELRSSRNKPVVHVFRRG